MKIDTLRSIAHNLADSLGSGIGMLIGVYEMDVFGEAARSPNGFIEVDFLTGEVTHGVVSASLAKAIAKYRTALVDLCAKQGASIEDFQNLSARYSIDAFNKRISVTIGDHHGKRAVDEYVGMPARHVKVTDQVRRIRTIRGKRTRPKSL